MTTLIIVESPNKVAKIKSYLGAGYEVMASVGHIRDLPAKGSIGVEPPSFRPQYEPTERGKDVIKRLKNAASGAGKILLATDPDREGEAIAWHIARALGISHPQRITFNEITKDRILEAVAAPRTLDFALVAAQETRRVLDRIIGFRVSPALSDQLNLSGLSAGRVQSPAVRIVVDRERAIKAFTPTSHYGAEVSFLGNNEGTWTAQWDTKSLVTKDSPYVLDQKLAETVSTTSPLKVVSFEDKTASRGPSAPFTTSSLQQVAGKRLCLSPKETMALAQELFANGHITYHRTDAPNMSEDGRSAIVAWATENSLPVSKKVRKWKAKEGAQEGHEAIRPTHVENKIAGETEEQKSLYRLIWQRAVASQLADAVYAVRSVKLEGNNYVFSAKGRALQDAGWMAVYSAEAGDDKEEDGEGEISNPIPALTIGDVLTPQRGRVLSKKTAPPQRYTAPTLVAELERLGIGRPSTFAAIIENITNRSYVVTDKKNRLIPSKVGETVRDALVGRFCFVDLEYTRNLEECLDKIASKVEGVSYLSVVSEMWERLSVELKELSTVASVAPTYPCPKCQSRLRRIKGKNGFFWGCSNQDCQTTLPDTQGKPGAAKPKAQPSGFKCPSCDGDLTRRQGRKKKGTKVVNYDFYSCLAFPKCKETLQTGPDGKPKFSP